MYGSFLRVDIFERVHIRSLTREAVELSQQALGIIVLVQEPVSVSTLAAIMQIELPSVRSMLHPLRSVLLITDYEIEVIHKSFAQFLLSESDPDNEFSIDQKATHLFLINALFKIMEEQLTTFSWQLATVNNVVKVARESPDANALSPTLCYACKFRIHHLLLSGEGDSDLLSSLRVFAAQMLVNWVEMLSILGELRIVMNHTSSLLQWMDNV
ncbi:hypothetical protein BJ742DRAFT_742181 [Cladochytrium replicatum]|nr:hypothetical protein BJ742DRAFT_742181 [Cladochytrium replicatum]